MTNSLELFKAATTGSKDLLSQRSPTTTFGPQSTSSELSLWGANDPNTIQVTEDSVLGLSPFWAGITIISEAMAMAPIYVYKKRKSGGRDIADQHPSQYCLTKTNNGWMTPSVFKSFCQGCLLLSGNALGEIVRNGRGQAVEIHHWLPRNTQYGVDSTGNPMYGVVGMPYNTPMLPVITWQNIRTPVVQWFPHTEVVHLKGFSTDGYLGRSVVATQRNSLSLGLTIEKFGQRFFTKGRPTGFLTKKGPLLSKEQKDELRAEWEELYEGVSKALGVGVLSGGFEWQQMGFTNDDAQFLQNRQFQVSEYARMLRISPHLLGDLSQVTEANLEQLMLELVLWTLKPWMTRWVEELNLKLFTPMEQFTYEVDFDTEGMLRGDRLKTVQADDIQVKNGTRTPEEIRLRDHYNPYPDGVGAEPLVMASQLGLLRQVEDGTSPLQQKPEPKGATSGKAD